jgi:hypothetical protein
VTIQDIFHEAVSKLGGRLNPAALIHGTTAASFADLRKTCEGWIAAVKSSCTRLPPIHFDFVNSESVNAWAFLHKKHHFIGVTVGAVIALDGMFDRMFADSRILTHIGNPSICVEHPPLVLNQAYPNRN